MRTFVSFATALCAIAFMTATAIAQPGGPSQPPPPPEPATVPPPAAAAADSTVDQGVLDDANSGRTWFSPTALTPPKGTWTFSNHMLFLVGGSYSPTDTVAISASTLIPISSDQPFFGYFTGKVQLVRSGRVRFAGHASAVVITDDEDGFSVGTLGGALSYCLDPECHSLINVFAGGGFSSETDNSSVPIVVSGSLIQRLSQRVKLVLEADSALILGEINDVGEGVLAWYGARFTSRNIGVDFGLFKPLCADCNTEDVFPLGFPWLSFTYRGGL